MDPTCLHSKRELTNIICQYSPEQIFFLILATIQTHCKLSQADINPFQYNSLK